MPNITAWLQVHKAYKVRRVQPDDAKDFIALERNLSEPEIMLTTTPT